MTLIHIILLRYTLPNHKKTNHFTCISNDIDFQSYCNTGGAVNTSSRLMSWCFRRCLGFILYSRNLICFEVVRVKIGCMDEVTKNLTKRRTSICAKITFAGENTCRTDRRISAKRKGVAYEADALTKRSGKCIENIDSGSHGIASFASSTSS